GARTARSLVDVAGFSDLDRLMVVRLSRGSGRWSWAWYAAVPVAAWTVYWLAFFPGVVSHDSIAQWREILEGRYDDWHPAFHTWTLWFLTRPWRSLGAVSLAQVMLGGLLVGGFLAATRRLGASALATWSAAVWLAVSPVFGMSVIAVGKDTAFGLALVWTTMLLLRARMRGALTIGAGAWSCASLALLFLFRPTGPAVAWPILCGTVWCYRRTGLRALLIASCVLGVSVGLVKGPVYRLVEVTPASPKLQQQVVIHHVA